MRINFIIMILRVNKLMNTNMFSSVFISIMYTFDVIAPMCVDRPSFQFVSKYIEPNPK